MKTCLWCGVSKPEGLFYKRADRPGTRYPYCKVCYCDSHKRRRLLPEHLLSCKLRREHDKVRRKNDPHFRMRQYLSNSINARLAGNRKHLSSLALVGCSTRALRKYIESKFKGGMTWENRGMFGWHIDHIKPCASFNLSDPEQQKECFHYTNLQPLWWWENLAKGAK